MKMEDLRDKILNKLAERATFDKEMDEWSVPYESAYAIVRSAFEQVLMEDKK